MIAPALHYVSWGKAAFPGLSRGLCRIVDADFYEKALFVKPTWRLYRRKERGLRDSERLS
jgi:hypothetical protein